MFTGDLDIVRMVFPSLSVNKTTWFMVSPAQHRGRGDMHERLIQIYGVELFSVVVLDGTQYGNFLRTHGGMVFGEVITEGDKYVSDKMFI